MAIHSKTLATGDDNGTWRAIKALQQGAIPVTFASGEGQPLRTVKLTAPPDPPRFGTFEAFCAYLRSVATLAFDAAGIAAVPAAAYRAVQTWIAAFRDYRLLFYSVPAGVSPKYTFYFLYILTPWVAHLRGKHA